MKSICVIIRKPPYGTNHAGEALRFAISAALEEIETKILLIQEGVHVGRKDQKSEKIGWPSLSEALKTAIESEAQVLVHGESLKAAGLKKEDLVSGAEILDDDEIFEAMREVEAVSTF
jgi:sulfur relay (sulfurtransferase) DsrF/TusC family protein